MIFVCKWGGGGWRGSRESVRAIDIIHIGGHRAVSSHTMTIHRRGDLITP